MALQHKQTASRAHLHRSHSHTVTHRARGEPEGAGESGPRRRAADASLPPARCTDTGRAYVWQRERETERETERDRETPRQSAREREGRPSERESVSQSASERAREREREEPCLRLTGAQAPGLKATRRRRRASARIREAARGTATAAREHAGRSRQSPGKERRRTPVAEGERAGDDSRTCVNAESTRPTNRSARTTLHQGDSHSDQLLVALTGE